VTICVLLLAGACSSPPLATATPSAHATSTSAAKKRAAKQRAAERKKLARAVRKDPRVVLKSSFVRKAQLVDFRLPITVRLTKPGVAPDDVLELGFFDGLIGDLAWPAGQDPPAVAPTTTVTGSFTMEMHFGTDTSGYSTPGTIETTQGAALTMSGTAVRISELEESCPDPAVESLPDTPGSPSIHFTAGGSTYGYVNWFTGKAYGTLKLKPSFGSTVRTACDAGSTVPPLAQPLTISLAYAGSFRFSPSIAADGRLRLGVIKALDTPPDALQPSVFGLLSAPGGPYPQRLTVKQLTADLLLGAT
jgi:hypothetical protein